MLKLHPGIGKTMTTAEYIAHLQKLDPSGQLPVIQGDIEGEYTSCQSAGSVMELCLPPGDGQDIRTAEYVRGVASRSRDDKGREIKAKGFFFKALVV